MTSSMSQSIPIASRHVARRSFASPTSDVWKVTNAIWWMRHWCNLRKKWCQFKTGSKFNSRLTPNDKNAVNVVLLKKDEKTFDKCQVSIEKKTKNVANVSNFAERLKRPLMTIKAWIASTDIVTWKRDPGTFQRVSQCQPEPFSSVS